MTTKTKTTKATSKKMAAVKTALAGTAAKPEPQRLTRELVERTKRPVVKKSAKATEAAKTVEATKAAAVVHEEAGLCACGCGTPCTSKLAMRKARKGMAVWALGHDHKALVALCKEFGGTAGLISFVRGVQAKTAKKESV